MNYCRAKLEETQRAAVYQNYIADSLFFLQHIHVSDGEKKQMFSLRMSEVLDSVMHPQKQKTEEDADEVIARIKKKAENARGNKDECI